MKRYNKRLFLKGLPTSYGVGIGSIYILHNENYKLNFAHIEEAGIKNQIARLDSGIIKTIEEILNLKDQLKGRLEENEKLILDVYITILEDDIFINNIKNIIKIQKLYAENAVEISFNNYINQINGNSDEYIKQRIYDLNEIKGRLIKNIIGGKGPLFDKIFHKHIVAVKELTPTLAAELGKKRVMGILAKEGGTFFSHAAILLRGLGIPLINDINFVNIMKYENSQAIIDGQEGLLIINPVSTEIESYREVLKRNIKKQKKLFINRKKHTITKDGRIIKIFANIGDIEECNLAKDKSVDGIGLVRTEILFAANKIIPDDREQFLTYLKIVKKIRNKPIVFRTFDFGGDKPPKYSHEKFMKTDLKLRGIKRSLFFKSEFIIQLRCILQIAEYGDVRITFPMVNNADEVKDAKEIIQNIIADIYKNTKNTSREIKTGAFIENQEAIENLDSILNEVSFINIGTNDLFQYMMGTDRLIGSCTENEYLDPEFLKILKFCISKAKAKKKHVIVCGEMAGDPLGALLLIGMGASELSSSPSKITEIRTIVNKINFNEAKKISERAIKCSSVLGVRKILSEWILKVGSDIDV